MVRQHFLNFVLHGVTAGSLHYRRTLCGLLIMKINSKLRIFNYRVVKFSNLGGDIVVVILV